MTKRMKHGSVEDSVLILKHWHEAVPNDRLAHLIKDATRLFLRALQTRLTPYDVSLGHWTFLRILWERDGLTQKELSVEAGVMEPTTLAAIRTMEAQGYLVRRQKSDNRKNIYIYLTPEGKRLKRQLVPKAEEVNAVAVQGISADDIALVRHTLLAMIENLSRDEAANADRRTVPSPNSHQP